jgi:hypothetical protein
MNSASTHSQVGFKLALILSLWVTTSGAQIFVRPVVGEPQRTRASRTLRRHPLPAQATQNNQDNESASAISAPISGYVADGGHRGVRPVYGFRMFSFIGDLMDFGEDVASVLSSPNQNYIAEVATTGLLSLWVEVRDGLGQVVLPTDTSSTSVVTSSPLGFSLVVVSESKASVQVFSSLPNKPTLTQSAHFSDLGGTPVVVAITDDGSTLLFSIRGGERPHAGAGAVGQGAGPRSGHDLLYSFQSGGQPQLIYVGRVSVR